MTDRYFVDTNILVYSRDARDPAKHQIARRWLAELWSSGNGRISTQVLKEYYQTVTRRLTPGMAIEEARADVRDLQTWKPLELTSETFEQAWVIEDRMHISWWDALIVAAARQSGCNFLISEDLQSGQTIENLTIINPFTTAVNEAQGYLAQRAGRGSHARFEEALSRVADSEPEPYDKL